MQGNNFGSYNQNQILTDIQMSVLTALAVIWLVIKHEIQILLQLNTYKYLKQESPSNSLEILK